MTERPSASPASTLGRWLTQGPRAVGTLVLVGHTVLALIIFVWVHFSSRDAQAGIQWVIIMGLDAPITFTLWDPVASSVPMEALADWGNSWGDGNSLRALVIYGVLGGAQWFAIGWLVGALFWPRTGWIAKWFAQPS